MINRTISFSNEQATLDFGSRVSQACKRADIIYLHGNPGSGKITFSRSFIQSLGHTGNIKNPNYTLIEPYVIKNTIVYHFGLYRLSNPNEPEFIGFRDCFSSDAICLIEWPKHDAGVIPNLDVKIYLDCHKMGREARISAISPSEYSLLAHLRS